MIPQPSRRGRWLTICCGQRFWGRSKWGGRGHRQYTEHWKQDHLEEHAVTSRKYAPAAGLLAVYIGSIVASNWLTTRYGLVAVAPGLMATAGTFAVGGAIMTRDLLQDAAGRLAVVAAIAVGAALSFALASPRIAVASAITFLIGELAEFTVYTPLRHRVGWGTARWSGVVGIANLTGAVIDTLLFLALAGFPLTGPVVLGQLVGKAYVTVAVIALGLMIRRAVSEPAVNPAGA